jgi:hypothetical protein
MTLEELEREVQGLKARAAADTAFLRSMLFALSTEQLRGARQTLATVGEGMAVKLLFMPDVSDTASEEFDQRRRFWLRELEALIDDRARVR